MISARPAEVRAKIYTEEKLTPWNNSFTIGVCHGSDASKFGKGLIESGALNPVHLKNKGLRTMPLFEVETDAHIIITWADDEGTAQQVAHEAYPHDEVIRLTKRPRDCWVISKSVLGITPESGDPCTVARDCLAKAAGDKVHAIRLYMHETGTDLDQARKVIESNMVMGW